MVINVTKTKKNIYNADGYKRDTYKYRKIPKLIGNLEARLNLNRSWT